MPSSDTYNCLSNTERLLLILSLLNQPRAERKKALPVGMMEDSMVEISLLYRVSNTIHLAANKRCMAVRR